MRAQNPWPRLQKLTSSAMPLRLPYVLQPGETVTGRFAVKLVLPVNLTRHLAGPREGLIMHQEYRSVKAVLLGTLALTYLLLFVLGRLFSRKQCRCHAEGRGPLGMTYFEKMLFLKTNQFVLQGQCVKGGASSGLAFKRNILPSFSSAKLHAVIYKKIHYLKCSICNFYDSTNILKCFNVIIVL